MDNVQVTVDEKGKTLTIVMPLIENPRPSASGKTLVVATTRGNFRTNATVNDAPLTVGVNAYIKRPK